MVDQLLNRKTVRGRTYYLVRWQGHASAADSWEPAEHLENCPERVAEYEAAASRRPSPSGLRRAHQRAGPPPLAQAATPPALPPPPAAAPPPQPPPGWASVAVGSQDLGSALLYWWPDEGWQLGRVRRRCRRAPITHVVGYPTTTATFAGEVDTLLDPTTCGSRWVSLTRVAPSG